MEFEYAFELVGVLFLILILISNSAKNWLYLRANRVFNWLLAACLAASVLDLAVHYIVSKYSVSITGRYFMGMLTSLSALGVLVAFYLYYQALTFHMDRKYDRMFFIFLIPALLLAAADISNPWTHIVMTFQKNGYRMHMGEFLSIGVFVFYVVGMIMLAIYSSDCISRATAVATIALSIVHVVLVYIQFHVTQGRYLLMFYSADLLAVLCYFVFQNMDRFQDRVSGGFSRAGFRKVIMEKCLYQEGFGCLFISIKNYQNLESICTPEGLLTVMQEIGQVLRRCGGKHNQYHIHGSEFVVMQETEEDTVRLYHQVLEQLPEQMRVNNRTIAINYGFYMLTLEEASFNRGDFYRIFSSMKKLLKQQTDSKKLMRFEGEIKDTIMLDLFIGRKLKRILAEEKVEALFMPIVEVVDGIPYALEVLPIITTDNGERIEVEKVWNVAKEMGCLREVSRILLSNVLEYLSREKIFEEGIQEIHMNVLPLHICSDVMIRNYQELAQKYQVPMNRICLELSEDMSVSQNVLREYLLKWKEAGVRLVLDHYGENICNLQSIMNMPFDLVKVNRFMVAEYCSGESDILEYQMDMLRERGWEVCLEGIDDTIRYQKVMKLPMKYLQGNYICRPMSMGRLQAYISHVFEKK